MLRNISIRDVAPWVIVGIVTVGATAFAMRGFEAWEHAPTVTVPATDPEAQITLAPEQNDTLQFAPDALSRMGYRVATVEQAPPPPALKLQGRVDLDPNTLLPIKARFPGEVIQVADFEGGNRGLPTRPLQYGDHVHKGQLLAVIRSKEVGEKKSELLDALSKLHTREDILDRLEKAAEGAIALKDIIQAKRDVAEATVNVANARRTLESWQISDDEIKDVYQEAERLQNHKPGDGKHGGDSLKEDTKVERTWASAELRSAIDGVILEKNINRGIMVDPSDDLFKVADTSHIVIRAQVYEEDLPTLRCLAPDKRHWKIDLKSDPFDEPVSGAFEVIIGIIDPAQHTATVMGTLDNTTGRMNLGQFVTATINLDADPAMVAVPAKAVIEDGSLAAVFVQDNLHSNEFTRRLVAITSRIPGRVCIRSEPNEAEHAAGAKPLKAGERVLASGVLELNAELSVLKAAQPQVQARVHMP